MKQYAKNLTPLEVKVEDATSNEPWGPHGTVMSGEEKFEFPNMYVHWRVRNVFLGPEYAVCYLPHDCLKIRTHFRPISEDTFEVTSFLYLHLSPAEITKASYDFENYKQIMGVIARRLQSEGESWRHVYKSLLLLEYMCKHGPQKVSLDKSCEAASFSSSCRQIL